MDAGVRPEWRVLLLGGTTASGKSTTGRLLAKALGIPCLSADSIWRAVLALTTAETHPQLFEWPRPEVVPDDPEHLLQVHIGEAEESDIMSSMLERSKRSEPDARQLIVARVGWLYGNWIQDGAKKHGLPMVAARPRETLIERIIEATR